MAQTQRDDLHRSWSARKARRWAVQQWVREYGWVCPGWHGGPYPEPHAVTVGYLSADHPVDVVAGGAMYGQQYGVLCRSCNSSKGATARAAAARARARGGLRPRRQPPATTTRSSTIDLAW